MRRLIPTLAAAAVLLAGPSLLAANYGRALVINESLHAGIQPAEDVDDYIFEAGTGWKVTLKAKRDKSADLAPVLSLVAPDGSVETEGVKAKAGKSSAKLSATLLEGGRFAARVTGASGSGGYTLSWKLKQAKVAKVSNRELAPDTVTRFPFPARGGTLLSWTLKFKGDGAAQVASVEDPEGGDAGYDPEDDTYVTRRLTSEKVKDFPLPEDGVGGDWNLVVDNKLFSSTATIAIKLKNPKLPKTSAELTFEEPVLHSISHTLSTCGVVVTLEGENLGTSPKGLWFGSEAASGLTVTGGTTLTCGVPAGSGTVDLVFVAADGQVAILEQAFTFEPLPVVTSFSPDRGPNVGGIELSLFGSGFIPSSLDLYEVIVGGIPASQVRVNDEGDIVTCIMPAHVSGPKEVVVRNTCGEEIEVPGDFTYGSGLYITGVRPSAAPAFGQIPVEISGTNFSLTDTVLLDGNPIATTPVTFQGAVIAHRIEASDLPAHAPGPVDVRVNATTGEYATKSPGLRYFAFSDATSGIPAASSTDDWGGNSMALADKDGDGTVDWIIITHEAQLSGVRPGTRILENDGTGVFTDVTSTAMPDVTETEGWAGNAVVAGRLNGDQIPDIYLSRAGTGVYWSAGDWNEARMLSTQKNVDPWGMLLFPDEEGVFTAPVISGPLGLLNISGLLVCNATWNCAGAFRGANVCLMYDFDFRSVNVAMGDLDGDFDQDIVLLNDESLADFEGTAVAVWVSCYGYVVAYQYYDAESYGHATRILTTGSNGSLTDRTEDFMETEASADEDFRAVGGFVADLSGDFLNDILIVHNQPMTKAGNPISAARALLQKNTGNSVTFKQDQQFFPKPQSTLDDDYRGDAISCADLNIDFWRDVIVSLDGPPPAGASFSTRILVQDPITGFGVDRTDEIFTGLLPAGDDARARVIITRDIDKDGDIDVILATPGDAGTGNRKTRFLLNIGPDPDTGIPQFVDASSLFPDPGIDPGNAVDIQLGDVDGDKDLDLVVTDTHLNGGVTKRTRIWKQDR